MTLLCKVVALCLLSNAISSNNLAGEQGSLYNNQGYRNHVGFNAEKTEQMLKKRDSATEASSGWHFPWQYKPSDFNGIY